MREGKVALLLRIRKELKDRIAGVARDEHRSLNQQIEFILDEFLSDRQKHVDAENRKRSRK